MNPELLKALEANMFDRHEYESEHNRVGNVKVVKRLDIHWYFPFVLSCGALPLY